MVTGTRITDPTQLIAGTPIVIDGWPRAGTVTRVEEERFFFTSPDGSEHGFFFTDAGILPYKGDYYHPSYATYAVEEAAMRRIDSHKRCTRPTYVPSALWLMCR